MQITPAISARFSRMSYTDIFALALRFGIEGVPPALKPSHARQSCLGCENQHPLHVDLLFGLAGQTQADLEYELEQLCAGGLPHQVTMFPLRIAKGTPLADELQQQGALDVMSHNLRMLEFDALVEKRLRERSFIRSEAPISYYREDARPHRYQSVEGRIVGLGAGAGSVLEGAESVNHRDVARYIGDLRENRFPVAHDGHFTREQARERYVLFRSRFIHSQDLGGLLPGTERGASVWRVVSAQ